MIKSHPGTVDKCRPDWISHFAKIVNSVKLTILSAFYTINHDK